MKTIAFIFIFGIVCVLSYTNPNTAISGASGNYALLAETTIGDAYLSNTEVYDALGESFSIEVWIRKTIGPGDYRPIISKHPNTPGNITNIDNGQTEFLLEIQYNDALNFFSGCGSYVNYGYYVAVDQIMNYPELHKYIVQENRWTHVAVTVDWRQDIINIPTGIVKIYADAILVDAALWAASSPICNGRRRIRQPGWPVRLGYFDNQDPGFQYYVGDIDELRIWSVARTHEEIKKYYTGGVPLDSPGLVSFHTFSEGLYSPVSYNVVVGSNGFPEVILNPIMWGVSDLKLTPNTAVACRGYTVTQQPIGTNGVDFYITKIIQNTDAIFLWSDGRDPRQRNIRRQITAADLPLDIGPQSTSNILEYKPGTVIGIDIVYYEARNNASYPEPTGPAALVFETRCCGNVTADRCRVCDGLNNTLCGITCDQRGGSFDACGVCNGNGLSCKGCNGIAFSSAEYDLCGVCGGDSSSCNGPCDGEIDLCGVCNGTNACCATYKGVPKDRIDHILIGYTLDELITKLEAAREIVQSSSIFVRNHNQRYNRQDYWNPLYVDIPSDLPARLSNRIYSINSFCSVTDQFIEEIDSFLVTYGEQIRVPWPPLRFPFDLNADFEFPEFGNMQLK